MFQSILATVLGIAGTAIFLWAPVTVFIGQKRGNWEVGHKRMFRYYALSQLGITVMLVALVVADFGNWQAAILGFVIFTAVHALDFANHQLQMRWLARVAKKLREEPRWR